MAPVAEIEKAPKVPTEEAPEHGEISLCGVVISESLHWVEDGVHIFRSTEFDVMGAHEDLKTAVEIFIQNAEDYAATLAGVDDMTLSEADHVIALLRRFTRAADVYMARERKRLINVRINLPGKRGRHRGGYNPSRRQSSLPPQLV